MTDDVRLERIFADGLHDLAPTRAPDRLRTQVKSETSDVRPSPRWLALIKEPPMRTDTRIAVGSPTARVAAIMTATLLAALLIAGAGVAGAQLLAADGPIVVDQSGEGTVETITEAVAMAQDGDEILVRPGTYSEAVVIDKDITLRGDGPVEDIVVTAPEDGPTVPIEDGGYIIIGGGPIGVFDGSAPLIEANRLSDGPHIFGFGFGDGAVIRKNTVEGVLVRGIGVFDTPTAMVIEGNTIIDPPLHGIDVHVGSPTVRGNTVSGAGTAGISTSARSSLLENRLTDNQTGVIVTASEGQVSGNVIRGGTIGIMASAANSGVEFAANDVEGASSRGMSLLSGSPALRGNRLCGNGANLVIADAASPDIDDSNEICEDAPAE
jgi:nitrous oxidase accessory protein NosD